MYYTCQYLKFGDNESRVHGYEEDLKLSNEPYAPIPKKIVDPDSNAIWSLEFSYELGAFYHRDSKVPGQDGAIIKSWYSQAGDPGPHCLALTPFVVGENCTEGFAQVHNFVSFSEAPTSENSVNTDDIKNPTVTATVHSELPEYENLDVSTRATSHSVILTIKTMRAVFDRIFVYHVDPGTSIPIDNVITVSKGQSCFAIAVFKCITSSKASNEISTIQHPKIPKWEWPMIVAKVIEEIVVKGNGEIYEHLSPKFIAEVEPEAGKKAISDITKRINELTKLKSVISGLAEKKSK